MSYKGDLKKVIKRLKAQGWRVKDCKKHRLAFPADENHRPVRLVRTPSSRSTWRNQLAGLKRKGYRE